MTAGLSSSVDSWNEAVGLRRRLADCKSWISMRHACLLALLACAGCRTRPEAPPPAPEPPDGRETWEDPEGVMHTSLSSLGVMTFGEERAGALPGQEVFSGYEFHGQAGVTASVSARLEGCAVGLLALYGPQAATGLWGQALVHQTGDGDLALDHEIDAGGMYFILLRCFEGEGVGYEVALECADCAEPSACEQVAPCDLFCVEDLERDEFDCRACACIQPPSCEDVACDDDQRCEAGVCVDREAPCNERCPNEVREVCGDDGVTYPNACRAQCADVGFSGGACPIDPSECGPERHCPDRQLCVGGRCCDCPERQEPMCGADGETYINACVMECAGVDPRHEGRCLSDQPCENSDECRRGFECRPAGFPGNEEACRDPENEACVRVCLPPPRIQRCSREDRECDDARTFCYIPEGGRAGGCVFRCDPEHPRCPPMGVCAVLPGGPDRGGVCLRGCDPGRRHMCEPPLACLEDARGTHVCQPGDVDCAELCAESPDMPVCARGHTLRNPCVARCEGHRRFTMGACGGDECLDRCADEMLLLLCGDRTVYASVCEARCAGAEPARLPGECMPDVATRCRNEEDCLRTGCHESVCAAEPTRACPDYSPTAACFTEGACGCVEGVCQWRPDEHTRECVQALRGRDGRPGE